MSFKQSALSSLFLKAHSDKAEAIASLTILLENPAGIGDHSTVDLHKNLNETLSKLSDADGRINTLTTYFPEIRNSQDGAVQE